ncbi:MAG: YceI family protein [Ilumatobacteraceae bacterium]|nr:YceI family protein [Ilumatobacteraceae bacterium]
MNSIRKNIIAIAIAALVLLVGGPWLYINVIKDDAPSRLTLDTVMATTPEKVVSPDTTSVVVPDGITGAWTIGSESIAGYRVKEILFGQSTEGVGRTSSVSGTLEIIDNSVTTAEFTVDMTTLKSDAAKRDAQFSGRIMDTATFPTATFTLTAPIVLPENATTGEKFSTTATGDLTLHGTTATVTIPIEAQLTNGKIAVQGTINIVFADYGIPNPSIGPIKTDDHGDLELLLVFGR